jgi:hypothetical protein
MLDNRLPRRVWQRLPAETFDSAENRFVLAFLEQLLIAAESLPAQPWWKNVPSEHKAAIRALSSLLRQTIYHPMFAEVGALAHLPLSSQVLLRREGYRDLLLLWQRFHQARRPLFEPLQQAIDLRDIARVYEMWVFFALVQKIICSLAARRISGSIDWCTTSSSPDAMAPFDLIRASCARTSYGLTTASRRSSSMPSFVCSLRLPGTITISRQPLRRWTIYIRCTPIAMPLAFPQWSVCTLAVRAYFTIAIGVA